jgi:hypothetical protein
MDKSMNSNRVLFRFECENYEKHLEKRKRSFSQPNDLQQEAESDTLFNMTKSSKRLKQPFHSSNLANDEQPNEGLSDTQHTSLRNILESRSPANIQNSLNIQSVFNFNISSNTCSIISTSELSESPSPSSSESSSSSNELVNSFEINLNLQNDTTIQETSTKPRKICFRAIRFSLKYNLDNLSLLRKETIFFLIERNQFKNILSPFDQFAYARMKKNSHTQTQYSRSRKNNYNYKSVQDVQNILEKFSQDPLNKQYLVKNNLLSNCVSQLLMPFFFDIFQPTELHTFNSESIEVMLLLRRSYKTEIFLKYESLIGYFVENLLWNCLIAYKYNFNQNSHCRMGYLNFYLSFLAILIHLNYVIFQSQNENLIRSYSRKIDDLKSFLELFLDSLIQNGLFKHLDYIKFKRFFLEKQFPFNETQLLIFNTNTPISDSKLYSKTSGFEQTYLNSSLRNLRNISMKTLPMKLKNLCRIQVKKLLNKNYNSITIEKFNLPKPIKDFILFDQEINSLLQLINIHHTVSVA